jgi:hypothetical protein
MARSEVPSEFRQVVQPTPAQRRYIVGLAQEKQLDPALTPEQIKYLSEEMVKPFDEQFIGVDIRRASGIIEYLKPLSRKSPAALSISDVPAGRYAVENEEGELRFYRVWVGRNGHTKLYVLHGPDSSEVPYKSAVSILKKIEDAGIREAAIRFGLEIGACSNCGRRLTNRISRALGIGPVCGGRMFGDDFRPMVTSKRQELIDAGYDPEEEIGEVPEHG